MKVSQLLAFALRATEIYKRVCPFDIYAPGRLMDIPSPSREHVVPVKYLRTRKQRDDLYNIFLCTSLINSVRGARRFGAVDPADPRVIYYSGETGLRTRDGPVDSRCARIGNVFEPPHLSRGPIARACLYMSICYPELSEVIDRHVLDPVTAMTWLLAYPPQPWESERVLCIGRVQGSC